MKKRYKSCMLFLQNRKEEANEDEKAIGKSNGIFWWERKQN